MSAAEGPVEAYLDDLLGRLQGSARDVRRALGESEDHLYARVDAAVAAGADPADAEAAAIAQFGSPATVAAAFNAALPLTARTGLLRALVGQLTALVGVGLVAVGFSGLLERVMAGVWGQVFAVADPPGTRYTAGSCRYWEAIHPHATTCTQAYIAESMADGLVQRYAAGVLGVAVLLVWTLVRRRRRLPLLGALSGVVPVILGATAFAVAAVIFAALAGDRFRVSSGNGAGQWLSAAIVAGLAAVAYGAVLLRTLRRAPAAVPPG